LALLTKRNSPKLRIEVLTPAESSKTIPNSLETLSAANFFNLLAHFSTFNAISRHSETCGGTSSPANDPNGHILDCSLIGAEDNWKHRKLHNIADMGSFHRSQMVRRLAAKGLQRCEASRQRHAPSRLKTFQRTKHRYGTPRKKIRLHLPHKLPLIPSSATLPFRVA